MLTGSQTGTLGATNMGVVNESTVPGIANTKGSARITHTCGYNRIKAKLVALQPSTGFSFDTTCTNI
jgi:hypothetical protein